MQQTFVHGHLVMQASDDLDILRQLHSHHGTTEPVRAGIRAERADVMLQTSMPQDPTTTATFIGFAMSLSIQVEISFVSAVAVSAVSSN